MVTQAQINELIQFASTEYPTVSLYLNTDLRHTTLEHIRILTKDLIKQRQEELKQQNLSHAQEESLKSDFKKLLHFVEEELSPGDFRGYAIFSCSGENFWQTYPLPQKVKNALIIDPDFYIRPLTAVMNQYHRYGFVIVDSRTAQFFEYFMGQMRELTDVISEDVPDRVRIAGWYGLEEKRIMRHIEYHLHQHYKRVANALFQLHNRLNFEYFIIGAHPEQLPEFERHLHRYIQDRIIERVNVTPRSWDTLKVKNALMEIENKFMFDRLNKMVDILITDAAKKNRATVGLKNVLTAANMGNIRLLMIEEDAQFPGRECFSCGYLTIEEETCPVCGSRTEQMDDLYDEIVENTVNFNGDFYQVPPGTQLKNHESIGAFLRFNLES